MTKLKSCPDAISPLAMRLAPFQITATKAPNSPRMMKELKAPR